MESLLTKHMISNHRKVIRCLVRIPLTLHELQKSSLNIHWPSLLGTQGRLARQSEAVRKPTAFFLRELSFFLKLTKMVIRKRPSDFSS